MALGAELAHAAIRGQPLRERYRVRPPEPQVAMLVEIAEHGRSSGIREARESSASVPSESANAGTAPVRYFTVRPMLPPLADAGVVTSRMSSSTTSRTDEDHIAAVQRLMGDAESTFGASQDHLVRERSILGRDVDSELELARSMGDERGGAAVLFIRGLNEVVSGHHPP